MCRMLAVRSGDGSTRRGVLSAFRSQADHSVTGPLSHRSHRDGWGLVGVLPAGLGYMGRSVRDASRDPAFEAAVDAAERLGAETFALAHVRNASVGGSRVENSHPFVRDGWAFCHNGTIHGLDAPPGLSPAGDTDSERYFLHLLAAHAETGSMVEAVRAVVPAIAAEHPHSSLTFLLTDGVELFALRRVGPNPGGCGTRECALEHYVVGHGRVGDAFVVAQEPEFLPGLDGWTEVPDGHLLHVPRNGPPKLHPIFDAPPRATRRSLHAMPR